MRASVSFRARGCARPWNGADGADDEPVSSRAEATRAASTRRKLDAVSVASARCSNGVKSRLSADRHQQFVHEVRVRHDGNESARPSQIPTREADASGAAEDFVETRGSSDRGLVGRAGKKCTR